MRFFLSTRRQMTRVCRRRVSSLDNERWSISQRCRDKARRRFSPVALWTSPRPACSPPERTPALTSDSVRTTLHLQHDALTVKAETSKRLSICCTAVHNSAPAFAWHVNDSYEQRCSDRPDIIARWFLTKLNWATCVCDNDDRGQAQAKRRAATWAGAGAWLTKRAGTSNAGQTKRLGRRASRRPKSSQRGFRFKMSQALELVPHQAAVHWLR